MTVFLGDMILGSLLTCQMCIGIMGNSLLFIFYVYVFLLQPHQKKPIDSIFMHLALVNILTIIFALLPYIMLSFGVQYFLDNAGCKAVVFLYRVTRGLSICTTSFLSAFQAVTIRSNNSKWTRLKAKMFMLIFPTFFFFWIINMFIFIPIIKNIRAISNFTLVGRGYFHAYCQTEQFADNTPGSYISIILLQDLLFVGLMICTSLSMVRHLYRHHRSVWHIHSPSFSSHTAAELKATQSILVLVSCFVIFYCLNNVMTLYSFYTPKKLPVLEGISGILSSCYPTFCPFLLIRNHKISSWFTISFSMIRIVCC